MFCERQARSLRVLNEDTVRLHKTSPSLLDQRHVRAHAFARKENYNYPWYRATLPIYTPKEKNTFKK